MTDVLRWEAQDVEPSISGDVAFLSFDSEKEGRRITVWMQRPVFEQLAARMQRVLEEEQRANPSQKKS